MNSLFIFISRLFFLMAFMSSNLYGVTFNKKKNFEWGAGFLAIKGDHYRGSDQTKNWFFPSPYFTYSSENIEAEPSFVRGTIFQRNKFAFKLSLLVGLNVESESNDARKGMDDLDWTFEYGPMIIYNLWNSDNKKLILNFEWPFRNVVETDLSYFKGIGFYSIPYLNLIHLPSNNLWGWSGEFSIGPMWATKKYHDHYFSVEPRFANPSRPAYSSGTGYSGLQIAWILNKRIGNFVFTPFIRYDFLKGAKFEDSPLIKQNHYFIFGTGLFWLFG